MRQNRLNDSCKKQFLAFINIRRERLNSLYRMINDGKWVAQYYISMMKTSCHWYVHIVLGSGRCYLKENIKDQNFVILLYVFWYTNQKLKNWRKEKDLSHKCNIEWYCRRSITFSSESMVCSRNYDQRFDLKGKVHFSHLCILLKN